MPKVTQKVRMSLRSCWQKVLERSRGLVQCRNRLVAPSAESTRKKSLSSTNRASVAAALEVAAAFVVAVDVAVAA